MEENWFEKLRLSVCLVSLILVTVGVATLIAMAGEDRGWPRSYAIIVSATFAVLSVWVVCYVYHIGRCAVWRFTRGYPFVRGDTVEITSGVDAGKRGQVVALGQAPWMLQIQLDDVQDGGWFSANQLRKISLNE